MEAVKARETWFVRDAESEWAASLDHGTKQWLITNRNGRSRVDPDGKLGKRIIKAISTHGSGGNDAV